MSTIRRILVANRGEIARRVFRTCRELGIETVAVFSDADADMPFVHEADLAVRIGPADAAASYLAIDKVLDAAARAGADAVHPGYGFLAENAAFAQAVADAGLVWIGPSPASIVAMGLKRESKASVAAAGVPVVPGYDGPFDDAGAVAAEAERIGYPVLVKASAGGGGKGMRVVDDASELAAAVDGARREAKAAFGDDTLILEKYVASPRHVEFQVLGDTHGNVVHVFERECSIQRRHQKIIEESPSPALDDALRDEMGAAAVAAAQSVDYVGAGTVEFILAPDGAFYFLEMNTRLQVEHPVTEEVTGLDLVEQQIRIAEGQELEFEQHDLAMSGAALECRIYAEDVAAGFLPAVGKLAAWVGRDQTNVRVEAGVEAGNTVSVHYDPMIAKVVTWGVDREAARRSMLDALRRMSLVGIVTNRAYLCDVLAHPAYVAGDIDTHFVTTHADALAPPLSNDALRVAAASAVLAARSRRLAARTLLPHVSPGYRNVTNGPTRVVFDAGERSVEVAYRNTGADTVAMDVHLDDDTATLSTRVVGARGDSGFAFEIDGIVYAVDVVASEANTTVRSVLGEVVLSERPRFPVAGAETVEGGCLAPMPGKVVAVHVSVGDAVEPGTALLVMEAMKMEQTIVADTAGVVAELRVSVGDQVDADALLAVVGPAE